MARLALGRAGLVVASATEASAVVDGTVVAMAWAVSVAVVGAGAAASVVSGGGVVKEKEGGVEYRKLVVFSMWE